MVGADIKTICNNAGFIAVQEDRKEVIMNDFISAIDTVANKY